MNRGARRSDRHSSKLMSGTTDVFTGFEPAPPAQSATTNRLIAASSDSPESSDWIVALRNGFLAEVVLTGENRGSGAVVRAGFRENAAHMRADGMLAEKEDIRDVSVGMPGCYESQHLNLAR